MDFPPWDFDIVGFSFCPSWTKDYKNGTHCLPSWHILHSVIPKRSTNGSYVKKIFHIIMLYYPLGHDHQWDFNLWYKIEKGKKDQTGLIMWQQVESLRLVHPLHHLTDLLGARAASWLSGGQGRQLDSMICWQERNAYWNKMQSYRDRAADPAGTRVLRRVQ